MPRRSAARETLSVEATSMKYVKSVGDGIIGTRLR
jgi:hypothetical protein